MQGRTCCSLFGRSLKAEFKWKAFGLQHPDPFQMSLPQWQWMDGVVYISYRFVTATILITWLACEVPFEIRQLGDKPMFLYFTYATEWSFIIFTLTSIGFAAFCIYYKLNPDRSDTVVGDRILWFFVLLSTNTILTTSGIYWISFWDREYSYFFKLTSKLKHSIPAVLVILDLFVNNVPMRLMHFAYPLAMGAFYALFTYVYWLSGSVGYIGNGIIYPIMNWNKPEQAVGACVLALVFCCIVQVAVYLLYFLRTYMSYLVGGRGVQTFRSLCSENTDENQLITREESDLLEGDLAVGAAKTYSSLE